MSERVRLARKKETANEVPPIVQDALSSSSQPLDSDTRDFMEPRFGHDFSQVRVHTDERAVESAEEVNALAYTVGQDVVFGQGQYEPETGEGKRLLAHELTHVVQQDNVYAPVDSGHITPANHPSEQQANAMSQGMPTPLDAIPSGISLQRGDRPDATVMVDPQTGVMNIEFLEGDTIISGEPLDEAEDNNPAAIASILDSIKVASRTETKPLFQPWEIFQLMPHNPRKKKPLYAALKAAQKKLSISEDAARDAAGDPRKAKQLAKAQADFEQARQNLKSYIKKYVLSSDDELKKLAKQKKGLQRRLTSLRKRKADQEEQDDVQKELEGVEKAEQNRQEALSGSIEGAPYEPVETERTYYTIIIDGAKVSLYDHVDAYATVCERGLEGKATVTGPSKGATVDELLDQDTTLSESRKKILKTISRFEGGFTAVNTWDRAVLTWGMVQWTGGDHSDLTQALTIIKKTDPEAFERRFQKYGIDVDKNQLVITPAAGSEIRGGAAAQAVQASPQLTAVVSAAGLDPAIQLGELKAANEVEITKALDTMLEVEAPEVEGRKARIRAGDIFTSEYGAGVLANQTVHGGFPKGDLQKALAAFVKERGFQPNDQQWVADAEQSLIPVVARDPDRAAALQKVCDSTSGSFH